MPISNPHLSVSFGRKQAYVITHMHTTILTYRPIETLLFLLQMQEPSSTPDAEMDAQANDPLGTLDNPESSDCAPAAKRPKLADEASNLPRHIANITRLTSRLSYCSYIEDLQKAREANFKRGSGLLFEFWLNRFNPDMKRLVQTTQICSFLYHQHRKLVWQLQNVRFKSFLEDPTKPFLVRDYEYPRLSNLGCNGSDLCIDKIPCKLDSDTLSHFSRHLDSLTLPETEEEVVLMQHLHMTRRDYSLMVQERSNFLAMSHSEGLIVKVCVSFKGFYEVIDPILSNLGLETSKIIGDLREIETASTLNAVHVFHEPYIKALFKALENHGYISPRLKSPSPFRLCAGHLSEGPFCCQTTLSKYKYY